MASSWGTGEYIARTMLEEPDDQMRNLTGGISSITVNHMEFQVSSPN